MLRILSLLAFCSAKFHKNLQEKFRDILEFVKGYIHRYESTISNQGFLLSRRIRKVFTTHCFNRYYRTEKQNIVAHVTIQFYVL